jgi:hypothetical protein
MKWFKKPKAETRALEAPRFTLWQNVVGALSAIFPVVRDSTTFAADAETRSRAWLSDDVQAPMENRTADEKAEIDSWVKSFDDLDVVVPAPVPETAPAPARELLVEVSDDCVLSAEEDVPAHLAARRALDIKEAWQGRPVLRLSSSFQEVSIDLSSASAALVDDYLRSFLTQDGSTDARGVSLHSAMDAAAIPQPPRGAQAPTVTWLPPLDEYGQNAVPAALFPVDAENRRVSLRGLKDFLSGRGLRLPSLFGAASPRQPSPGVSAESSSRPKGSSARALPRSAA